MFPAPAIPTFVTGQSATTTTYLRFEDVTQDGRLIPIALTATTAGLWREVLVDHKGARNALKSGVLPILTRNTLITTGKQIRVDREIECRAGFELAHDRDANGEVTRLFMNVWSEVYGIAGKLTRGDNAPGERVLAGTLFAEHTFTRLLGPPDQRKVTSLSADGYPVVPEVRYTAPPPTTAGDAPPGAQWLDELAPDTTEHCFTLDQTDSNQHVNSLNYIRLFSDAANRRFAAGGHSPKLRSREVDIAYRKPCFAGDRVRVMLRRFQSGEDLGAAGYVVGSDDKPRCYVRVLVGP